MPRRTTGINAGIPAFEAALKANHVNYEIFTYPGTQHGFNNDTTPRYDQSRRGPRLAADHGLFQEESRRLRAAPASILCRGMLRQRRRALPRHLLGLPAASRTRALHELLDLSSPHSPPA